MEMLCGCKLFFSVFFFLRISGTGRDRRGQCRGRGRRRGRGIGRGGRGRGDQGHHNRGRGGGVARSRGRGRGRASGVKKTIASFPESVTTTKKKSRGLKTFCFKFSFFFLNIAVLFHFACCVELV